VEIRQLIYFLQICKDKSFSKASGNLYITQQALSHSVKNLEDELGISLFNRNKHGIELTEIGAYIEEQSRPIIAEFERICLSITDQSNFQKGSISIAVTAGVDFFLIPQVLLGFQEKYMDIQFDIKECNDSECERMVEEEIVPIACSVAPIRSAKLHYIPFIRHDSVLLVNKSNVLASKTTVYFTDLKNEKFSFVSKNFNRYWYFIEQCHKNHFEPNIIYTSSLLDPIVSMVEKNLAVTPLSSELAKRFISNNIQIVPFDPKEEFFWEAGFIYKNNYHLDHVIKLFIDYTLSRNFEQL
jgi:DNA-binding transcriptional LysR family regulator